VPLLCAAPCGNCGFAVLVVPPVLVGWCERTEKNKSRCFKRRGRVHGSCYPEPVDVVRLRVIPRSRASWETDRIRGLGIRLHQNGRKAEDIVTSFCSGCSEAVPIRTFCPCIDARAVYKVGEFP